MGNPRLIEIMEEKDALYAKPDFSEEDGIRAGELEAEFADLDGWNAESDAEFMLNKLGVTDEYHYMKMAELPSDLKVKVLLAKALFGNPDILLLDEPTNHLDLAAIRWLENFLLDFENTVIVEKYIKGREFAVGIVGSRVLPGIEIIPKHGFYDYKNKYQPGCTVEICPADIDSDTAERMAEATRKVFRVLGLGAYARADFMVDENGIYCLEANTLPGMTPVSLLPQEAAADKLDFPALLEAIIKESLLLRETERRH